MGAPGDSGVIAQDEHGKPLGAAWYRLYTEHAHGYGFVATDVPEITIGVLSQVRSQGIGASLLSALIDDARRARHPALSLSVEDGNGAKRLYERIGFVGVTQVEGAATMLLDLSLPG